MGEMVTETEVLVIGAGPGGYVAAMRAAQLGKEVILVDKAELGGICLHDGCIPSKALIHASSFMQEIREAKSMGIDVGKPKLDPKQLQKWKEKIVKDLTSGIEHLCKKLDIQIVKGSAVFESSTRVKINNNPDVEAIEFDSCIIATGSQPRQLPFANFDGKFIISSNEALKLETIPKYLVVIGGGYIGLELSVHFAKLGSRVTILERGERIVKRMPKDISEVLTKRVEELNIKVLYNTEAKKVGKHSLTIATKGKSSILKAHKILVAVGRVPVTKPLALGKTKVELDDHGFIKVNDTMKTSDPNIYAIGDVIGNPMLAHKASRQGKVAAEVIAGVNTAFDNQCCPAVMFTDPEIATVGLDVTQAKEQGYEVIIGKFPFSALGKAYTQNKKQGFTKLIFDKKSEVLLGAQIIGGNASDMISELALAIEMGATQQDIAVTIHPHPTFPESIVEAAEAAKNAAIHIFKK